MKRFHSLTLAAARLRFGALGLSLFLTLPLLPRAAEAEPASPSRIEAVKARRLLAQRRRRRGGRKRRKQRPPKQETPPPAEQAQAPPPAAAPANGGASGTPATQEGGALRRSNRMEFDARLVQGQTAQSGAVYLFNRAPRRLPPLVELRQSYLDRIVVPVLGKGALKKGARHKKK